MTTRAPGRVRIIGGRWRRRQLPVPAGLGVRPTPDRVRETVFNWLAPSLPGTRCLDLFAGSGALGLEAASRGARQVVLVERERALAQALRETVRALGAEAVEVVEDDAERWLASAPAPFDVVFLDPPFGTADPGGLCARLGAAGVLAPGALVFVESDRDADALGLPPGWSVIRGGRAGRVRYHLAASG